LHPFDKKQEPDSDPHQSEKPDPDPAAITYYDKRFLLHGAPDSEMTVLACRHPVLFIQQLNTV
jgi:hypothetical protein